MAEERVQRRLAAILVADVVAYSRLMGVDEEGTLAVLTAHRAQLIDPCIADHHGRLVKTTGDGMLAEFASVVDAVRCAVEVQDGMAERSTGVPDDRRIALRIGVNLGDVIIQDDDVFGDGVNIAARLEGLAEPGGIIVSDKVRDEVVSKVDFAFADLGPQEVKNIARPVHAYRLVKDRPADPERSRAVFNQPSIAVLPFDNMSNDPEQDYVADGLTDDIITALSSWRSFPVIARNSTFMYKGKAVQVQQVAAELGARYVLEGGIRKAGNTVRVTAQLVDAETGHHVWAQKFDRKLEDIFAVQDEISRLIAVTAVPELEKAETRRSAALHPNGLDAWDCYLRGLEFLYKATGEGNARARELFERALDLDPAYGRAFAGISYIHSRELILSHAVSFNDTAADCLRAAERAVDLEPGDSFIRTVLVRALIWSGRYDAAIEEAGRALELNQYDSQAHIWMGATLVHVGRTEEGIPIFEHGLALASRDPRNNIFLTELALAYLTIGEIERALERARTAALRRSEFIEAQLILAAIYSHMGEVAKGKLVLNDLSETSLREVDERLFWRFYRDTAPKKFVLEGLRKLGLPE